jgi:hypothetical protein
MKDKLRGISVGLFFAGLAAIPVLSALYVTKQPETQVQTQAISAVAEPEPTCTTEPIPFETQRNGTYDLYLGDERTVTEGVNGERKVCTKQDNTQVINDVTIQPITKIVEYGQASRPVYRTGAICNDGTRSYATGRGACSRHGGVYEWTY